MKPIDLPRVQKVVYHHGSSLKLGSIVNVCRGSMFLQSTETRILFSTINFVAVKSHHVYFP